MDIMSDQPVTRGELLGALATLKADILEGVQETVRDAQTEILKAFLPYQEGSGIRMRALEAKLSSADASLTGRMAVLEQRLQEIEKKLLLNPPAA